jgi:hypothetical protein
MSEEVGVAILRALQLSRLQEHSTIPFELRMLEVVLDRTVSYLESKAAQMRLLSRAVEDDINKRVNTADIRRMLPLQKAVTGLEYDIKETKTAIREVRSALLRAPELARQRMHNLILHCRSLSSKSFGNSCSACPRCMCRSATFASKRVILFNATKA